MRRLFFFAGSFGLVFCLGLLYLVITACKNADEASPPALNGLYRTFPAVPQFGAAVGDAYIFSDKSDVYKGWPGTQSPETFDFAKARSQHPAQTGKYVINAEKIIFRWSNGQSDTASFSIRRDSKTGRTTTFIGPNYCYKIIPWNKPLNNTFEPSTYQGGFSDPDPKIPVLRSAITFSAEGRFTITAESQSGSPVQGTYKVIGTGLTLLVTDGRKFDYSLHVFEDHATSPQAVLINGRPFYAKKK